MSGTGFHIEDEDGVYQGDLDWDDLEEIVDPDAGPTYEDFDNDSDEDD